MSSMDDSDNQRKDTIEGTLTRGFDAFVNTIQSQVIDKIQVYLGAFIMSLTNE